MTCQLGNRNNPFISTFMTMVKSGEVQTSTNLYNPEFTD